jgi:hemolysin III
MNIAKTASFYTVGEEIANSVLHGIGTLLATAGLVLLSLRAAGLLGGQNLGSLGMVAVLVFAVTMIGMYLISTLYHAIQHEGAKRVLRKLDHSVIYIFIAGTYTPFCISGLGGIWGWGLFTFQWSLALLGISMNILEYRHLKKIMVAVYLLMGWSIVVGFVPLLRSVPFQCVILLFAGGAAYTLGTLWYRKKHIKLTHAVWHVFVLIGTICHWFAVWYLFGISNVIPY